MARNQLYISYLSSKRHGVLANMVPAPVKRLENDAMEQAFSADENQEMPDPIGSAEPYRHRESVLHPNPGHWI
jgi:hypothetical protein